MKTWKQCAFLSFLAVIALASVFTACDDGNDKKNNSTDPNSNGDPVLCTCVEKAHLEVGKSCDCDGTDCNCSEKPIVPEATTRSLTFTYNGTPADGTFAVTVKTENEYTTDVWNTLVNELVTALETTYASTSGNSAKARLELVFNINSIAQIVLVNDLSWNWEVITGDQYGILRLKVTSIDTADYTTAVSFMYSNNPLNEDDANILPF